MTNKLVVITNSLKVPKIKKILLYEVSCTKLQLPPEPLTSEGYRPQIPVLCPLSSTEFVEPPPEQNSWVRHCNTEDIGEPQDSKGQRTGYSKEFLFAELYSFCFRQKSWL